MFRVLAEVLRGLDWSGALLGAVVSGVFAGSWGIMRLVWRKRPLRRFLDDLSDERKPLAIFVRNMVSSDSKYSSTLPDGRIEHWQNFSVVGQADVEVATDVLNLLGQAGRARNFSWRSISEEWGNWSDPLICVGDSFKASKALELCTPRLVRFDRPDTFVTEQNSMSFQADAQFDYGLIYRGHHPQTHNSCLVLFGAGVQGTEAAGAYLRRHARILARLYGSGAFAAIIRVGWQDGRDSGSVVWLSSGVSRLLPALHLRTWLRHRHVISKPPQT